LLPRTGELTTLSSRLNNERHYCRFGPTCRLHLLLRPDWFLSGWPIACRRNMIKKALGRGWIGFDFWASLLSAIRFRDFLFSRIDPALGFASCRVVDTPPCIRAGSTPLESPASGNADGSLPSAAPIRSWALRDPSRQICGHVRKPAGYPPAHTPLTCWLRGCCPAAHEPFSVLMGLMPCLSRRFSTSKSSSSGSAPCLRFCTFRERNESSEVHG